MRRPGQIPDNLIFSITISKASETVKLTAIEARIIRLIALGYDDHQMAAITGRSVRSIRGCKTRALKKIDAAAPNNSAGRRLGKAT